MAGYGVEKRLAKSDFPSSNHSFHRGIIRWSRLCSHLKWILFSLEVCAGVLCTDTIGAYLTSAKSIYKKPSYIAARGRICKYVCCHCSLNTGVKSLQSSTLKARMSLTESRNHVVFFRASIAL